MPLFEAKIRELQSWRQGLADQPRPLALTKGAPWPRVANNQLILEQDTGAELGHVRLPSFSVILWTENLQLLRDVPVGLVGPDIPAIAALPRASAPFGKIVLLGTAPIPAEEAYSAFEKMDAVRFEMNLRGYMLRGFSQRNREWSRISRKACGEGFSFSVLGSELLRAYHKLPFVEKAEVLFLTDEAQIQALLAWAESCAQIGQALNTMFENINMDCKHCASAEICDEVDGLRKLHNELRA